MYAFLQNGLTAPWVWNGACHQESSGPFMMPHASYFASQPVSELLRKRKHHMLSVSVVSEVDGGAADWPIKNRSPRGGRNLEEGPPQEILYFFTLLRDHLRATWHLGPVTSTSPETDP